jgi:hypothetical protein
MKWRSAQVSLNAALVEASLEPSYLNPNNTFKFVDNVRAFHDSKLHELARTFAVKAIEYNPQSFDSWRLFLFIESATEEEIQKSLRQMHRLDPLNPKIENEIK